MNVRSGNRHYLIALGLAANLAYHLDNSPNEGMIGAVPFLTFGTGPMLRVLRQPKSRSHLIRSCVCFLAIPVLLFRGSLAAFEPIPNSTSPDGRLAFAYAEPQADTGVYLIRVSNMTAVGKLLATHASLGMPEHGGTVWNLKARRVALVQGGVPRCWTMVFEYSRDSFHELPLPRLDDLPRRWFSSATGFKRSYIAAKRWHGKNQLELTVSGVVIYNRGKADSDYVDYSLAVLVEFSQRKGSRIIHVKQTNIAGD